MACGSSHQCLRRQAKAQVVLMTVPLIVQIMRQGTDQKPPKPTLGQSVYIGQIMRLALG
jgi:hypothetical protein